MKQLTRIVGIGLIIGLGLTVIIESVMLVNMSRGHELFLRKTWHREFKTYINGYNGTGSEWSWPATIEMSGSYEDVWYLARKSRTSGDILYYESFCKRDGLGDFIEELNDTCREPIRDKLGREPSRRELVETILTLVQEIDYINDSVYSDGEFPKFPAETLFDEGGDCEDHAILFGTLCDMMGFEALLIKCRVRDQKGEEKTGHMMAAVRLDLADWTENGDKTTDLEFFYFGGEDYLLCEPTGREVIGTHPWINIIDEGVVKISSAW